MITTRELESRLRESAALYDREVQPIRDFDRRIMARVAITPKAVGRRPSLKRELVWSTVLAAAVLGLAVAVVVGIRSGILHQPNPAPVKHSPTPNLPPAPGSAVFVSNTFFVSSQVGWIESEGPPAGSPPAAANAPTIYKTTDGGQHWQAQLQWVGGNALQQILFQGNDGLLVGYDGSPLYRTTDGGAHWQRMSLPQVAPGEGGGADPIWFKNPYEGWYFGNLAQMYFDNTCPDLFGCSFAAIFHTVDGGAHWTQLPRFKPMLAFPNGGKGELRFRDELDGWFVVGSQLYATHDGGKTWTLVPLQLPALATNAQPTIVEPPHLFSNRQGLLVVRVAQSGQACFTPTCQHLAGSSPNLYLYTTTDGGDHWSAPAVLPTIGSVGFDQAAGFGDVFFLDADRYWIVSGQTVATTADGGQHWTIHGHVVLLTVFLSRPDFSSGTDGWVVGTAQANAQAMPETGLYRTTDGGAHWVLVTTPGS
jgi:photosystem II stability/assembly factor-like uncharacterized protein